MKPSDRMTLIILSATIGGAVSVWAKSIAIGWTVSMSLLFVLYLVHGVLDRNQ